MPHGHIGHGLIHLRIAVPGDHIHLLSPFLQIQAVKQPPDVRGNGNERRNCLNGIVLRLITSQNGIGHKTLVIQHHPLEAAVVPVQIGRRHNLLPIINGMPPEAHIPAPVQLLHGPIALLQPFPECCRTLPAITMRPVFIGHMPDQQRRMLLVTQGHPPGQLHRETAVYPAVGAKIHPGAVGTFIPVNVHRQNLGILPRHPGGLGGGGGGQADVNAVFRNKIKDLIQPLKGIRGFVRLQLGPAEDRKGHNVDACLLKKPHILVPDFLRPLIGIVVTAIPDGRELGIYHGNNPPFLLIITDDYSLMIIY
ncbi:hypothetical protein D3C75_667140 [compost metagenome]